MLTAGPSFDSSSVRTVATPAGTGQWGIARGTRHRRRHSGGARPGESGWWCAEMRSVLWATLGAVGATAILLLWLPALF